MKKKSLFDHIKEITSVQKSDYWEKISEEDKKTWSNYMVHRFLSMNMDWIELVNELQKYNLKPKSIVYFEDLEKNLQTAYKIGITTVHIKNSKQSADKKPFINYRFKTINGALDMIKKFLN